MNHDLPELWLRDLAGEALSASERALLAEALRSDPELRRRLLADHWVDGTLRALGRSAGDAAEFVRSTTSRWRHEQDAATFVAGTVARARPDLQMPTRNRWRRWLAPLAAVSGHRLPTHGQHHRELPILTRLEGNTRTPVGF